MNRDCTRLRQNGFKRNEWLSDTRSRPSPGVAQFLNRFPRNTKCEQQQRKGEISDRCCVGGLSLCLSPFLLSNEAGRSICYHFKVLAIEKEKDPSFWFNENAHRRKKERKKKERKLSFLFYLDEKIGILVKTFTLFFKMRKYIIYKLRGRTSLRMYRISR